jgi:hypothetical protein
VYKTAAQAAPEIDAELGDLTSGAVTGINQVARLLAWLQQQGCAMVKLDRPAIERQLGGDYLPPAVRRVLELRLGGAQAAVRRSTHCCSVPASTIACAAPSATTVPLPAAGPARDCSRRI